MLLGPADHSDDEGIVPTHLTKDNGGLLLGCVLSIVMCL